MTISILVATLATPAIGGAPIAMGAPNVRLMTENVQIGLNRGVASIEGRYVFKNLSGGPLETKVHFAFEPYGEGSVMAPRVTATWDKDPVTATNSYSKSMLTLRLRKDATHVLRVNYSVAYPSADGNAAFSYSTAGGRTWRGAIDRADYKLKYDENSVYDVAGFDGGLGKWQWSPKGAYLQRTAFVPAASERWTFNFYTPDR